VVNAGIIQIYTTPSSFRIVIPNKQIVNVVPDSALIVPGFVIPKKKLNVLLDSQKKKTKLNVLP
jgi:hypothetical protein